MKKIGGIGEEKPAKLLVCYHEVRMLGLVVIFSFPLFYWYIGLAFVVLAMISFLTLKLLKFLMDIQNIRNYVLTLFKFC